MINVPQIKENLWNWSLYQQIKAIFDQIHIKIRENASIACNPCPDKPAFEGASKWACRLTDALKQKMASAACWILSSAQAWDIYPLPAKRQPCHGTGTTDCLKEVTIAAIPNGMLQEKYNPTTEDNIWLAGRNAPSLGEDFRVRLSFAKLKAKAGWRVQVVNYDEAKNESSGSWQS